MSSDTVLPILLIMAVILSGIYAGNYDAGKEFSGSNDGGSLIYLNQEFGFKFYPSAAWQIQCAGDGLGRPWCGRRTAGENSSKWSTVFAASSPLDPGSSASGYPDYGLYAGPVGIDAAGQVSYWRCPDRTKRAWQEQWLCLCPACSIQFCLSRRIRRS